MVTAGHTQTGSGAPEKPEPSPQPQTPRALHEEWGCVREGKDCERKRDGEMRSGDRENEPGRRKGGGERRWREQKETRIKKDVWGQGMKGLENTQKGYRNKPEGLAVGGREIG